jgi:hypothetical protein
MKFGWLYVITGCVITGLINGNIIMFVLITMDACSELERLVRGFEFLLKHELVTASFYILLSCVCRGLATAQSPNQGHRIKCAKGSYI